MDSVILLKSQIVRKQKSIQISKRSLRNESIAKKLQNFKCIELCLETMDHTFCQWIYRKFPQIKSIKLNLIQSDNWIAIKLQDIRVFFSSKIVSINIELNRFLRNFMESVQKVQNILYLKKYIYIHNLCALEKRIELSYFAFYAQSAHPIISTIISKTSFISK